MRTVKKALCLGLCVLLLLSVCILPASAADYPEPSATDPAAWYLYGDNDRDGKVTTTDARAILRAAAYLDTVPASDGMTYGASDYDRDGRLTTRDARLVLRLAVGLEEPAAQTAHPYASKSSVSAAEAIAMLQSLNDILKPEDTSKRIPFTYSDNQVCDVELRMTSELSRLIPSNLKEELNGSIETTERENTKSETLQITTQGSYLNYLQVKGSASVVFGDISTSVVKSTAFSYNAENNTYTVRINFNNSVTGTNSADSPLRQVIGDINTAEQIQQLAELNVDSEDVQMTLEATIDGVHYTVQDTVSGAYVEYTINAVSGIPVSAEYGYTSTLTVPTTLFKITDTFFNHAMVMITKQDLTMNYDFHG